MIEIFKKYNLLEILILMKKYYKMLFITLFFSIIGSVINYILPLINMKIIDDGIMSSNYRNIILFVSIYFIVIVISSFLDIISKKYDYKFSNIMELDLKKSIINYFMNLRGSDYRKFSSGEIDAIIKGDVTIIMSLILSTPIDIITNIVGLILSIGMMLAIESKMTILIVIFQIMCLLIRIKFNKYIENSSIDQRKSYSCTNNLLNEIINNIRNIRLLNSKSYINSRYDREMKKTQNFIMKSVLLNEYLKKALNLMDALLTCIMLLIGGMLVVKNNMTIGGLITIMQYSGKFSAPLSGLIGISTQLSGSKMQIENITNILESIRKSSKPEKNISIGNIQSINIQNLSFSYDKNIVFSDASVEFKKGDINFLIGKSGSGKTTLTKILMGEYNIDNNMVCFDDVDINNIPCNIINKYISWIPQEPILFNDTIYNNITLEKGHDLKIIEEVCKDCNIYDDIINLENGFETLIDEKGYNLSAGQKQRIAIVRALLQETPIIIIDEPTSSLDKNTESILKENILKHIKEKVVIIITHSNDFIIPSANVYEVKNKNILRVNF